ncbi:MAG: DUF3782 domain-containing protein [Oligoflexia bacterium]|nr:DUF3782 domain-containing protein [Oligoflexia bacterium]
MTATNSEVQEIWSLIKETNQQIKALSTETDKLRASQKENEVWIKKFSVETDKLRASQQQTDEQMKKTDEQMKKTDEQMRRTDIKLDKFIGDTGNRWGKLGENLVKGSLAQKLRERGVKVEKVITNAKYGGIEFDIIAINGKETVIVEVKATLDPSDVDKFKKNMEKFKTLWPEFKKKTVYGAMAFLLKSNRQAEKLAEKQGFFVISATGDVIIKNEEGFEPKAFN